MRLRAGLGLSLVMLAGLTLVAPARSDDANGAQNIDRAMVQVSRKLVKELQGRGYGNVGVLKFLVSRDGKTYSDSVGTLNMLLAKQLEVALLVKNDPKNPLAIIKNASAVAQRTRGANHRNKAGRDKLFGAKYTLSWGNNAEVTADGFVTGLAILGEDLKTLTIILMLVDGKENKIVRLGDDFVIVAKMDPRLLAESGESFMLRSAFDDGQVKIDPEVREQKVTAAAIKSAVKAREEKQQNPYFAPANAKPVTLQVLYDDVPAKITFRDGKAHIPTAKVGQKVKFRLTRDNGKDVYGVVLKVNGESTYHKQKGPDLECTRWIMKPGSGGFTLSAFRLPGDKKAEFKVLSVRESAKLAMSYGEDSGTISLAVFKQRKAELAGHDPSDRDYQKETIVRKAKVPDGVPESYGALVAQIEEEGTRSLEEGGLIGSGPVTDADKLKTFKFDPDPNPIMNLTIVYYKP